MLRDFLKLKADIVQLVPAIHRQVVENEFPLLANMKAVQINEGKSWSFEREDGKVVKQRPKKFQARTEIKTEELKRESFPEFVERHRRMAQELLRQQVKHLIATVDKAATEVGNVVNAKGAPMSPEVILEQYEKVDMDFNEDGTPRLPTLMCNPEMGPKVEEAWRQLTEDPEYRKRLEELLRRKRDEWLARKGHRKLVD